MEITSRINELLTFQRSALPPVKSPDPPSPCEILEAIRAGVVWVWEQDYCATPSNRMLKGRLCQHAELSHGSNTVDCLALLLSLSVSSLLRF